MRMPLFFFAGFLKEPNLFSVLKTKSSVHSVRLKLRVPHAHGTIV
jgi:hypothetical protein